MTGGHGTVFVVDKTGECELEVSERTESFELEVRRFIESSDELDLYISILSLSSSLCTIEDVGEYNVS